MDVLKSAIDIFINLDEHLVTVIAQYGTLTYFLLFLIIFLETGVVVTPFLPGDSLLFAAGGLVSPESFYIRLFFILLWLFGRLCVTLDFLVQ